jgi:CBS domain containing-hemolysin-like protein
VTALIVTAAIVVIGSGLCSSSEAALLSVPILKVRQRAEQKDSRARVLLGIKERINRPITTIVVFNNIFNIVGSILVGRQAAAVFGEAYLGLVSGVLTFFIIVLAEIIPKTIGERFAEPMSLAIAPVILALTKAFTPLVWVLEILTRPFSRQDTLSETDEAEIRFLASLGRRQGVIESDEADMIQRVFKLNDVTAEQLMTPRVCLSAVDGRRSLEEVVLQIADSQHTRIVIYDGSLDTVTGIGIKSKLLATYVRGETATRLSEIAAPVRFVEEHMRADDLLRLFQSSHEHLAVVLDDYGGTAGVVTLEDVIEVVTGSIEDETDESGDLISVARKRRERLLAESDIDVSPEE